MHGLGFEDYRRGSDLNRDILAETSFQLPSSRPALLKKDLRSTRLSDRGIGNHGQRRFKLISISNG